MIMYLYILDCACDIVCPFAHATLSWPSSDVTTGFKALALRSISTKLADLRRLAGPSKRRWWTWRTIHPANQLGMVKILQSKGSEKSHHDIQHWGWGLSGHVWETVGNSNFVSMDLVLVLALTDGRTVSVLLFRAMSVWCFESHVFESLRVSAPTRAWPWLAGPRFVPFVSQWELMAEFLYHFGCMEPML